jgi:hypothetical protein
MFCIGCSREVGAKNANLYNSELYIAIENKYEKGV